MNTTILSFAIEIFITLTVSFLLVGYLRPSLRKILLDLCRTEERAQFWAAFSNILLIGMPTIFALGFQPKTKTAEGLLFEIAGKLGGNLGGFLFALAAVGMMISFFALVAPRASKAEPK
jgi:hypothetical protein